MKKSDKVSVNAYANAKQNLDFFRRLKAKEDYRIFSASKIRMHISTNKEVISRFEKQQSKKASA